VAGRPRPDGPIVLARRAALMNGAHDRHRTGSEPRLRDIHSQATCCSAAVAVAVAVAGASNPFFNHNKSSNYERTLARWRATAAV
jgi:hypothetical protein